MYQALVTDKSGKALPTPPAQLGIPLPKCEHFSPRELEFVTGSDTVIRWLARRSDLIARISGFNP